MKMIAMVYYGSWEKWRYVMDGTFGSKQIGKSLKCDGWHFWLKAKVSKQEVQHGAARIWPSGVGPLVLRPLPRAKNAIHRI